MQLPFCLCYLLLCHRRCPQKPARVGFTSDAWQAEMILSEMLVVANLSSVPGLCWDHQFLHPLRFLPLPEQTASLVSTAGS